MKKQIVIDYKSMAFPLESLGSVQASGVHYAPGRVFDAVTQHYKDRLIAKGLAKEYSPTQTQAVDVRAASEEPAVQQSVQADALPNAAPEQVDNHAEDEPERRPPEGERSSSEAEASGSGSEDGGSARRRFFSK